MLFKVSRTAGKTPIWTLYVDSPSLAEINSVFRSSKHRPRYGEATLFLTVSSEKGDFAPTTTLETLDADMARLDEELL